MDYVCLYLLATDLYLPTIIGTKFSGHCWIPLPTPGAPHQFWRPFLSCCQHLRFFRVLPLGYRTCTALCPREQKLPRNSQLPGKPLNNDKWHLQQHPEFPAWLVETEVTFLKVTPLLSTCAFLVVFPPQDSSWMTALMNQDLLWGAQPKKTANYPTPG